jgi:hypothetical protein
LGLGLFGIVWNYFRGIVDRASVNKLPLNTEFVTSWGMHEGRQTYPSTAARIADRWQVSKVLMVRDMSLLKGPRYHRRSVGSVWNIGITRSRLPTVGMEEYLFASMSIKIRDIHSLRQILLQKLQVSALSRPLFLLEYQLQATRKPHNFQIHYCFQLFHVPVICRSNAW